MAKFTVRELDTLSSADIGNTIRDDGGLRGKIRANTKNRNGVSITFVFRYKWATKTIDLPCGSWPRDSMPEIRRARDDAKAKISAGISAREERKAETLLAKVNQSQVIAGLEEKLSRITVAALFDKWRNTELKNRRNGDGAAVRYFNKDILPVIGHLYAEDVKRAHIMEILDAVLARGANRMAKICLSDMRQMFGYALDREIIVADPTARIKKEKIGGKNVIRTRHRAEQEIQELFTCMPTANFIHTTECAVWIMLSTCCRVGEISRARWNDLDLEASRWKIPKEHAKNGKAHVIYLSEFAKNQFVKLLQCKVHPIWMYPNTTNDSHVCTKSITKQIGDRQRLVPLQCRTNANQSLVLSGGKFTSHDLRRTGSTLMGSMHIPTPVIQKCLNQTGENKIKIIYEQQALIEEQKAAFKMLGERLTSISNLSVAAKLSMFEA